jgi:hypothetical protein
MLVALALGLLLMLVAVFSAIHGGEEDKGEIRTKTLVYENDGNSRIGLYWMDDKSNLRKATPEEIRRCEKLHPDEQIPLCRTTYYEKDENKQ